MKRVESQWTPAYRYKRNRIDTTFSQRPGQFSLRKNYAKTLDGLITRVVTNLAAVAVAQAINHQQNRPLNHTLAA